MQLKKIAVTGGIGSGKSTVLSILNELGYKTLSSDKIVSDLYKTHRVKELLKAHFPTAVSGNQRLKINRAELASVAFSNEYSHALLTSLITPLVMQEIHKLTTRKKGIIFVEVPLLFECEYQGEFDGVWVIIRPLNERIASVKKRSNLTETQILERIKKQVDYDSFDLSPFTVIENDGNEQALKEKIMQKLKELL